MPLYEAEFKDDTELPMVQFGMASITAPDPLRAAKLLMGFQSAKGYTLNEIPFHTTGDNSETVFRAGNASGRATITVRDKAIKATPAPTVSTPMPKVKVTTIPAGFRAPTQDERNLHNDLAPVLKAEMKYQLTNPPNIDAHDKAKKVLQAFMSTYGFHDRDTGDFIVLERVGGATAETPARQDDEPATRPSSDHW